MLRWIIAKPLPPPPGPEESENTECPEAGSPADAGDQRHSQRRSQCTSEPSSHEYDSMCATAFADGKPLRKTSRGVWESSGFAGTEQESKDQERSKIPCQT